TWLPTRTRPRSGSSSRLMQRSSVDFPEPDGPITATTVPRSTASEIPLSTASDPNAFHRSVTSIIAADMRSIPTLEHALDHLGAERQGKQNSEIDRRNRRI